MLLQEKHNKMFVLFLTEVISLYIAGWCSLVIIPASNIAVELFYGIGFSCIGLATIQTIAYVVYWCIKHKIDRGVKYAFIHQRLICNVRQAFTEASANYVIEKYSGEEKIIQTPRIKVELNNDLTHGKIYLQNHIRFHTRLESINLSSALGKYIIEQQYVSDDENWYIYEFEDSSIDRQLVFNSYQEFVDYSKRCRNYTFFMDKKWKEIKLCSLLLVGATGSGKTYALYSLILEMLNWDIKPNIYFADPKNSSLFVIGKKISKDNTSGGIEGIISLLEKFHSEMILRKEVLQEKLEQKLDSDYKDWGMTANIFILDEYSSFQSVVDSMDKKTRDNVSMLIRNIVLQGRQLGFYLWIIMQKSDSSDIRTSVRDNLLWKVVLGSATRTTYITAFEESANLVQRKFGLGQGLFTYQGLTREPQIMSFPTLNFDILEAVNQIIN